MANIPAAFQHERLQAFFGELFRGPAARHSGPDDDRVELV
jgi:hypothetical protein